MHATIPVVHGSIFRFEGQATVFSPWTGPCYRCLFPVLGVLPGIIGSIQAMETIKLLLNLGDTLSGRLLTYDALDQRFMELRLRRNADCPACGIDGAPPPLVDYDDRCQPAARLP